MSKSIDDTPQLVSIVAISYRSESTIIATLESIQQQTYPRIELILCDDCSDDGTLRIASDWLLTNNKRFERFEIIVQPVNSGVSRNYEAGLMKCKGEWIKPIACDDILCADAISKLMDITQTENTELAFSQIAKFFIHNNQIKVAGNWLENERQIEKIRDPISLLKHIRIDNFLPAPGAFFSHRLLKAAGGIDTNFKHLDDWPFWLRILPLVQRVSWIDKPLVLYRLSESSISQGKKSGPIGAFLYADRQRLYRELQRPHLTGLDFWHLHLQMLRQRMTFETLGNSWLAYRLLMPLQLLSPLTWAGMVKHAMQALTLVLENVMPIARGTYYFGLSGLCAHVRVFGPINMEIPRSRVNIGRRVVIYKGVTLIGKKGTADTITIGSFSTLEKNSYVNAHGGSIILGDHVHVGVGCVMQGFGGVVIGDNTMFGPYAQVYSSNHRSSKPSLPRNLLGERPRAVNIGRNCWIAANCIILPGALVPDESVLPASEVVVRDKNENSGAKASQQNIATPLHPIGGGRNDG